MEKVGRQTLLGLAVLFIADRGVFPIRRFSRLFHSSKMNRE